MKNRWSEQKARRLSPLELLVYQSRLIGEDPSLVLWGGGNTSLKTLERDHTGREIRVLRVKGSGSDMKVAQARDFPGLQLDEILLLLERQDMADEEMVDYLARCQIEPESPRPSIEALLHAFIPFTSIVHSHADAILSLTNNIQREKAIKEALGEGIIVIPYRRPGFLLSKEVALAVQSQPDSKGVVLANHGLLTWGATPREAYDRHIELVAKAEQFLKSKSKRRLPLGPAVAPPLPEDKRHQVAAMVSPMIRGLLSKPRHMVLRYYDSQKILEFLSLSEAKRTAQEGAATADHLIRTKRIPLWVQATNFDDPDKLVDALRQNITAYAEEYTRWFHQHSQGQLPMLDPYPRIVLMPALGMWTIAPDVKGTIIASDIYHHTIDVIRGAQAIGGYRSLDPGHAFESEYWPLQWYKLSMMPQAKELSGKIALVTGAARGIGAAIARRLAQEGAHVAVTDIDSEGAQGTAQAINQELKENCCSAIALNVADEAQVRSAFERTCLAFGGLDILVSNAGVAYSAPIDQLDVASWERSLAINATGHFLVAREAVRIMKAQGLGGSLVFIATKNVTAPGRDFGAYSAAKAAEAQLARILAIENGPWGIRSNMVNPDAIFQGSQLWSKEIREQRAKAHNVSVDDLEDFYRQRNLLKAQVTAEDVAEAVLFLASDRSSKTTGAMLPVDGGLPEAFPR